MNIITSFLKKNPYYLANKEFDPKGIMVSMVGCPQPSAKVFINNWNRESCDKVCPHILIDANDGKIYQTLPYCVQGCFGDPEPNSQYISVMLCEPAQIKYHGGEKFEIVGDKEKAIEAMNRVHASAIEACATLCQMFGFNSDQIHSPAEGVNDPKEPNAFWRQLCRDDAILYSMNSFKSMVDKCLDSTSVTIGADRASGNNMSVVNGEIIENTFLPDEKAASISVGPIASMSVRTEEEEQAKEESYQVDLTYKEEPKVITVQIDVPNLRIRKGPGVGDGCEPIGKYTGVGQFQITKIQNGSGSEKGWGKLASGDGWISMDYVKVL